VRCEEVRPLLPELAEGGLRTAGPVEVHLSRCAVCSADLAALRAVVLELQGLRDVVAEPPAGLLDRLIEAIPEQRGRRLSRVVTGERVQHAALSLGGAVVGATAVGLLWWRAARRDPLAPARVSRREQPGTAGLPLRVGRREIAALARAR
jgi:hypothetical protein